MGAKIVTYDGFQSTLPCRERLRLQFLQNLINHFNPRSRVGSDNPIIYDSAKPRYFNPRSRVGSDKYKAGYATERIDFNPRSRVGSDRALSVRQQLLSVFQSTLPCRERPPAAVLSGLFHIFQSTLPCRERPEHT